MSELKPIAYAIYGIGGGKHYLKDVKPIQADDVTEEWRGDDDFLGDYWAGNEPLFLASTQPEATKPAQDLGAAILAMPCTVPEELMGHQAAVFGYKRGFNSAMSGASQLAIAFAALASPADALVAGDRVDVLEEAAQACDQQADGTNGIYRTACLQCANAVRELRDAAIQAQKDGHG